MSRASLVTVAIVGAGIEPQPVFKTTDGKRKLVRVKRVHRCFAPAFEDTTLAVTYAAS